ncbi:MAG: GAF domain-containing protein [Actinobacteria bacterium]|nr:MAG: GAF domain-containing protein [Actinomycetota bacterium]
MIRTTATGRWTWTWLGRSAGAPPCGPTTPGSSSVSNRPIWRPRRPGASSPSLDYEVTLNQLAELVVPALADWCVIQLAATGGQIDTVAIAHPDPDKMALARRLQERYPPDPHAPVGAGRVIRTGESELIRDIPESMLEELVSDPELLAILLDLRLRSSMAVPLTARGQVLGALTLVAAESGRTYAPSDLAVAEELGRRAGIAFDNARLYHDRDYIAQTLQRTLLPPSLPDIPGVGGRRLLRRVRHRRGRVEHRAG